MFILPGILGLVTFIFARPFEFVEVLRGIPFLYIFFGLTVFGYLVDLRLGFTELKAAPHLPWVLLFLLWCAVTAAIKAPSSLAYSGINLAIVLAIYFMIAHGVRTFKAFETVTAVVLACTIWISAICVHQGLSPFTCVAVAPGEDHTSPGRPDGRSCEQIPECYRDPPDPEALYRCEHAGLFGVTSIGRGRVRYVGVLHDPNEVALAVSVGMPFSFAFYQRRRSKGRLLLLLLTVVLAAITVIFSQSRGGQLVFMAVLGVYFIRRYGWKGIVAGAVLAVPIMMFGGRGGQEAGHSSTERLECWFAGLEMFRAWPFLGAGYGQFTQHHFLTAHNSFVLAPAELGILGVMVWTGIVYLAAKIPLTAIRSLGDHPEAKVAQIWGMALLASLCGMVVGVFFLSFNYHYVLWVYLGLSGAFYASVKRHSPDFEVRLGLRDWILLAMANGGLIGAMFVYVRLKLG